MDKVLQTVLWDFVNSFVYTFDCLLSQALYFFHIVQLLLKESLSPEFMSDVSKNGCPLEQENQANVM